MNSETVIKNEMNRFWFDDVFWLSFKLHSIDFILLLRHLRRSLFLIRTNNCAIASGRWLHVGSSMRCAKSVNVWKLYKNICIWNDWSAEVKFGKWRVFKCNVVFSLLLLLLLEQNSMKSPSGNCFFCVSNVSGEMHPIACCWLESSILPVSLVWTMKIDTFPSPLHSILPKIK